MCWCSDFAAVEIYVSLLQFCDKHALMKNGVFKDIL